MSYNSKYTGEKVEELLDKASVSASESFVSDTIDGLKQDMAENPSTYFPNIEFDIDEDGYLIIDM